MASVARRKDGRTGYQVRYRDPAGVQRARQFDRKADADRFAATVEADKARGTFIDPKAGRITLKDYADTWLKAQTFDESTREATELRLRLHVHPVLGQTPLAALRPSQIQAWLRGLQQSLAPRYVRVIHANLSAVLTAAVDDDRIAKNPCSAASVKLPALDPSKVTPWTAVQALGVHGALPERFRVMATLGAGCGLRQGEIFGLAVDDVDFLRGIVHVRRQVKLLAGRQVYALPKGRKIRDVPLPKTVALELAAHLQRFPAVPVELPWETTTGEGRAVKLVLSTRERTALQRNYINTRVWKPALLTAGLEDGRENGMHALRHFYASVLLDAGENVRALAEYLGHADPGFTLRVYTHLMPASEDRTKKAVDRVLGGEVAADGLTTCAPDVHHGAP
jgi:integrase